MFIFIKSSGDALCPVDGSIVIIEEIKSYQDRNVIWQEKGYHLEQLCIDLQYHTLRGQVGLNHASKNDLHSVASQAIHSSGVKGSGFPLICQTAALQVSNDGSTFKTAEFQEVNLRS